MKTSRLFLLAIFVLSTAGLMGCGGGDSKASDGGVSQFDASTGGGIDAGDEPATCNFTNCDGCCDGNICNNEASANKCGLSGQACQTCDTGDECFSGSCATPTATCNDNNCDGCCEGTQCLEGNVGAACGALGDACVACPDGQACSEIGDCEAIACDATSCPDGCCTGSGECIPTSIQDVDACGDGGGACNVCSNDAIDCVSGICIEDQPCLEFCTDGCCTPQGQCLDFTEQDPMSCGEEGMCEACTGDDSCIAGSCSPDPAWTITVDSAVLSPVDENDNTWDTFGGSDPDPYVTGALTNDFVVDWFTVTIDNTVTPNWDEEVGSYLQSDLIAEGLEFNVLDSDFASFETIGNCVMTISMGDLMQGSKTINCGDLVTDLVIDFAPQ